MTVRDPQTEPTAEEPAAIAATAPSEPTSPTEPATLATEPALAPAPPAPACPRCGTPLREDQDWCLNCGAAATSRIAAPAGWRAPLAVIAAVVALAFAGLLIAFLAVSDDSDELTRIAAQEAAQPAAATPVPTAAAPTPSPTPVPSATPGGTQTVPPAAAGGDDLPGLDSLPEASGSDKEDAGGSSGATSGGSAEIGTWPSGRSAFTVVLLSSPSRAGANRRARELAGSGTQVGVLDSDDFKSLNGGYYVVFSGQYDSRDAAEDALGALSGDAPGAYVRRVTPR